MRPVSDAFLRAVRGSHAMCARVRVVTPGQTGTDPDGTEIAVLDGDVELDPTTEIRSTFDITTDGNRLWPTGAGDLLAPYGNEVFIERGIAYGTGVREWVSLGYHRIETVEQDQAPRGPIRMSGQDRMAAIREARLVAPRQFQAAVTLGTVVDELIGEVYPTAVIEWDDASDLVTLGRSLIVEDDRFAFLADLVRARGKVWYWDHRGVLVIKDPPDPGAPVADVSAGAGGVLVSLARQLTRVGVFNAVVATGEGTDTATPVRAVAVDLSPTSRTYWFGSFGKIPHFYSSPFITDPAQAQTAANTVLRQSLGLPYNVDLTAVPNPALEPYDPIRVAYGGAVSPEVHVLSRISIPLRADGLLKATTREQTAVLVGALG